MSTKKEAIYDRDFKELVNNIYEQEFSEENKFINIIKNVRLVPSFSFNMSDYKLDITFKNEDDINSSKDLNDFYDNLQHKHINKTQDINITIYGDSELYKIVLKKYVDIIHFINQNNVNKFYTKKYFSEKILVRLTALEEIMDYAIRRELRIDLNKEQTRLFPNNIKLKYEVANKNEYCVISLKENLSDFKNIIYSKDAVYIIYKNIIYRCDKNFINNELKLIEIFLKSNINEIKFKNEDLPTFFSLIMPRITGNVRILDDYLYKYKPENLRVKLYLDFNNKNNLIANIIFSYNNREFNPLIEEPNDIKRNILKESIFLNKLRKIGFLYDGKNKNFIIADEDIIYKFITKELYNFDDYVITYGTDNFNNKKKKSNKNVSIGIQINNGLLDIDLNKLNYDKQELVEILQKYKLKKKFHRLKDGTFVDLEENQEIELLDNLLTGVDISYKEIDDYVRIPINRGLYLDKLLSYYSDVHIQKDEGYTNLVKDVTEKNNFSKIPEELDSILRDYQKLGFNWLKNLDKYKLGGILADDMGLGKTIQMLSIVLDYKKQNSDKKASIVVAPSSLLLNWYNEANKFANDLKVLIINGEASDRKNKIKQIPEYDLIITSYDLLKRDIEIYKENNYKFKYIIADEAQYIKNNNTKNAKAIKLVEAETRFALTGTPIENSLNELWSIFDYIMPGYLYTYKKFKQSFEIPIVRDNDEKALNKLKLLIEPFILRRTKKEVLKELPDKAITVLNNEMTEEQEKVYLSYLAQARDELTEEIEEKGFEQTRIKILALLTRLRQICCHPSLFISNYKGESGKLSQCIELVKDGINSGHKMLLFSGYTSMFEIIEKELILNNIKYLKLTGKTKLNERLDLIEEFNNSKEIKVFLISLKAGGTGINLTSADMVIHYDPWWNISVENQATDRTHRIGQTKKVQVYKLITKNSIEEKIYELQKRKEELIDNMLSTDSKFINRLSKEDILGLFE